jgi:DNA-binding response OmpR family regulator
VTANEILLFEDDPAMRDLIAATLQDAGYGVDVRPSDDSGQNVRVVLVDLGAPKTIGANHLRLVRERYPQARILAISARFHFNSASAASVAHQLGADRVLAKPLDCNALIANVRQLMREPPR